MPRSTPLPMPRARPPRVNEFQEAVVACSVEAEILELVRPQRSVGEERDNVTGWCGGAGGDINRARLIYR